MALAPLFAQGCCYGWAAVVAVALLLGVFGAACDQGVDISTCSRRPGIDFWSVLHLVRGSLQVIGRVQWTATGWAQPGTGQDE